MREKQTVLIITFNTTTDAIAAERRWGRDELAGQLIPVPRQLSAGCGLAWKALPQQEAALLASLRRAGLDWGRAEVLAL